MTFRNSVGEIYSWPEIANIQITGVSSCFWGKIGQQCQRVKDVNKENTKFLCNSKQRLCCFQCGVDWYYGPIEKVFRYTGRYKLFIFSPLVKGHLLRPKISWSILWKRKGTVGCCGGNEIFADAADAIYWAIWNSWEGAFDGVGYHCSPFQPLMNIIALHLTFCTKKCVIP